MRFLRAVSNRVLNASEDRDSVTLLGNQLHYLTNFLQSGILAACTVA